MSLEKKKEDYRLSATLKHFASLSFSMIENNLFLLGGEITWVILLQLTSVYNLGLEVGVWLQERHFTIILGTIDIGKHPASSYNN